MVYLYLFKILISNHSSINIIIRKQVHVAGRYIVKKLQYVG